MSERCDIESEFESDGLPGRAFLGTVALFFGAALACLLMIDRAAGLAFMPRSWHSDRALWSVFAIASFAAGCLLLRSARPADGASSRDESGSPASDEWRPAHPGVRFQRLRLYTRDGCHLCDEAKDVLEAHATYLPPLEEQDIESDPELVERFGTCVPVVEIDGTVRFRGRVNPVLLRRLIEGSRPKQP